MYNRLQPAARLFGNYAILPHEVDTQYIPLAAMMAQHLLSTSVGAGVLLCFCSANRGVQR